MRSPLYRDLGPQRDPLARGGQLRGHYFARHDEFDTVQPVDVGIQSRFSDHLNAAARLHFQLFAHRTVADAEFQEGSARHVRPSRLKPFEPCLRRGGTVDLHVLPDGTRQVQVGIIGPGRRSEPESQVQKVIPDLGVEPAVLQDFKEIHQAEGNVERQPASGVEPGREMGVARNTALSPGLLEDLVVEEVRRWRRMDGPIEVEVHRVPPMPRPRILLARHDDVPVLLVAARFAEGRLGKVDSGDIAHLENVRDVHVLGGHLNLDRGLVDAVARKVNVGVARDPSLGGQVRVPLKGNGREHPAPRRDLHRGLVGPVFGPARHHHLVRSRGHLRFVAPVDVEDLSALRRPRIPSAHPDPPHVIGEPMDHDGGGGGKGQSTRGVVQTRPRGDRLCRWRRQSPRGARGRRTAVQASCRYAVAGRHRSPPRRGDCPARCPRRELLVLRGGLGRE